MKKIITLLLVLIIGVGILSGCTEKSNLEKLVVTYVTSPLNIPTMVERDKQIFNENIKSMEIPVEYAEITSGADQTQALASGDVQVLYGVGATSVILSAANGADIKVLNMYSRSPKAFAMYSKDVNINTPQDLKGKTIAGPVGTNLHQMLIAYLASANMSIEDVNYVNMSIPDSKAGLDGGSVDIALLAGPIAYTAQQQGYKLIADGEGLIDAIIAVAVTEKFYTENKAVIEALIKSQDEISKFMNENYDETVSIAAKTLDIEEQAVKDMYAYYDFSTTISEKDIEGFQRTADFMFESGMIENTIDVKTLFLN